MVNKVFIFTQNCLKSQTPPTKVCHWTWLNPNLISCNSTVDVNSYKSSTRESSPAARPRDLKQHLEHEESRLSFSIVCFSRLNLMGTNLLLHFLIVTNNGPLKLIVSFYIVRCVFVYLFTQSAKSVEIWTFRKWIHLYQCLTIYITNIFTNALHEFAYLCI